jgi:hypothetical protein
MLITKENGAECCSVTSVPALYIRARSRKMRLMSNVIAQRQFFMADEAFLSPRLYGQKMFQQ